MSVRQRETSVHFKCRSSDNSTLQACQGGLSAWTVGSLFTLQTAVQDEGGGPHSPERETRSPLGDQQHSCSCLAGTRAPSVWVKGVKSTFFMLYDCRHSSNRKAPFV